MIVGFGAVKNPFLNFLDHVDCLLLELGTVRGNGTDGCEMRNVEVKY